ncbi:MAG: hypothetical protein J3Q66DRAFT_372119 [Benniella sp.]|nr:MAG: hypothetical protein J3Q66DRAFT_372119 [Benniella sp.]
MDQNSDSAASLRFLLLGDVGVGKSAFIDTLASTLSAVHSTDTVEEFIPIPITSAVTAPPAIRLPGVHLTAGPVLRENNTPFDDPLGLLPPKVATPFRDLTFITLPGYSSTINPSTVLSMTDDYLNHHLHSVTSIFSPSVPASQLAWFLIAGSRAHSLPTCAFYFVLYELKPIDILYMKMIHERVNLIPIITKADTLSVNELWVLKKRMLRQLKLNGIRIHTFGLDMDTIESMIQQRQWGAPPFVVSTRRNAGGQLLPSELKQLIDLCLYGRVRHLQEDATKRVIAWKNAFGFSGDPTSTSVEKLWSERSIPTAGAGAGTISSSTFLEANSSFFGRTETRSTEAITEQQLQQQQQQQQQQVSSPTTHFPNPFTTSDLPFTPPPPSVNGSPGPTTGGYAPPPSLTNGSASNTGYTAPPPSAPKPGPLQVSASGYQASVPASANGLVSPPPSASASIATAAPVISTAPFSPPPPPRTTSANPASPTLSRPLIHSATGLPIDSSTRPSEFMESNAIAGIAGSFMQNSRNHEARQPFTEDYVPAPGPVESPSPSTSQSTLSTKVSEGNEFKVEIPNSISSYQPGTSDTLTDLNNTLPPHLQQQQGGYILPGGFQSPPAFLIPPSELYQAVMMSTNAANGASTSTNDYLGEGIPDIWEAAELGDVATVQLHLNNGVSPDQRNNSRSTLLHRTAWQGVKPYAVMNLLISYGANVNLTNENGNTVLQNVLMKHDDPALIKLLLDNDAQTMIPNKEGMNTLEVAALFNKFESARYLLENDLPSSEPLSIHNALQRARGPDKKAMKALLKGWQGKDGERKRAELMDRKGIAVPISDAASVRSFETTKGGDAKSNKWLKLKF